MKTKLSSDTIVVRPSLKVFEALNPELYTVLASMPKDLRGELIMQILRDWSRGIITPMPEGWSVAGASEHRSVATTATSGVDGGIRPTANPTTTASVVSGRKQTSPDATSHLAAIKKSGKPAVARNDELTEPGNPEALFFQSMGDVGDAFDYISPNS